MPPQGNGSRRRRGSARTRSSAPRPRNLLKLRARVDADAVGEPSKLIVVTAVGGYAYTRPDGVAVVLVTALGP